MPRQRPQATKSVTDAVDRLLGHRLGPNNRHGIEGCSVTFERTRRGRRVTATDPNGQPLGKPIIVSA